MHKPSAVHSDPEILSGIRWMKERGATVGTCIPALCELEVGACQVRDPASYRKALARLLTTLRIWPLDEKTAFLYGDIYHQLRQRGCVCSRSI